MADVFDNSKIIISSSNTIQLILWLICSIIFLFPSSYSVVLVLD